MKHCKYQHIMRDIDKYCPIDGEPPEEKDGDRRWLLGIFAIAIVVFLVLKNPAIPERQKDNPSPVPITLTIPPTEKIVSIEGKNAENDVPETGIKVNPPIEKAVEVVESEPQLEAAPENNKSYANLPSEISSNGIDVKPTSNFQLFNSLLVSHAMIKLDKVNVKVPGVYKTNLSLRTGRSYGIIAWCAETRDSLDKKVAATNLYISVDGKEMNTLAYENIYRNDTKGNYCAVPGVIVTNINPGSHHFTVREEKRSDGSGDYEPGDYIWDIDVDFIK